MAWRRWIHGEHKHRCTTCYTSDGSLSSSIALYEHYAFLSLKQEPCLSREAPGLGFLKETATVYCLCSSDHPALYE